METLLFILILVLASHRVTRLITRDKLALIKVPRDWFVERWITYDDAPPEMDNVSISGHKTNIFMRSLAYLAECDWCMGVWVSAILTYGSTYFFVLPWNGWFPWVLVGAATASGVGLIASMEPADKSEDSK